VIPHAGVSRRHATVRPVADGYLLLDTSANGVFVNDARVQSELPLGRGDTIRVGPEDYRFYAEGEAQDFVLEPSLGHTGAHRAAPRHPPAPVAAATSPSSAPGRSRPVLGVLEVINEGPSRGVRHDLDSPRISVGRGAHNDVVLGDESVSEHHAKLQRREDGWYLVDVGSTNGTYLDGTRVSDEVRLESGSEVRFGGVKMRFHGVGTVARPSGETRVIVGVKGPDPKRAEQRLRELAERATPGEMAQPKGVSPILWIMVIVLVIIALYAAVRGGGH